MSKIKIKKKEIIKRLLLVLLVISPLTIFYSIYLTTYLTLPVAETAWVSWYDNPQHEVYIGWETPEDEMCTINYGTDPSNLHTQMIEEANYQFHCLNITSLIADTKYYYEILRGGKTYASGQFRTAPLEFSQFSFGLYSDTQQKVGPGWHQLIADTFATKNYSFIALVGDFVEDGPKSEWNHFLNVASAYFDTIPFVPVMGNHDKLRDGNYFFMDYFRNTADENGDQFYYSFNWGSVHFQILHIPEIDLDDGPQGNDKDYKNAFTENQLAWIEQDLANAQDLPFRITMFHCPITGAGFYGPNQILIDEMLPTLHNYNVTATIHGHAHHFERGVLKNPIHPGNDLYFFDVGTGGGLADVGLRPVPETEICLGSPSYTEVTATANTLTFSTYSPDGTILDDYQINGREN